MPELDDHELLAEFARRESETAFAALVARYVNLVYSAALRFTGNPHHAEEITQAVFIILARKAGSLRHGTVLSGWLYQTARLTAANFVKGEIRRQHREQEAYMQSTLNEPDAAAWEQLAPLLDEAMGGLGETDRNAVVLRFFENKTAAEVAAALKLTEAAAHKRVSRALEKLRRFFTKRGVILSAALITGAVSANSVQAAPAGLAATVTTTATKGTAISAALITLVKGTMKTMTWVKLKFAIGVGVTALLAGGAATVALSGGGAKPVAQPAQQEAPVLIVPGESVGKVRKGMTTNEVEVVFGKPDKWQGKIMLYDRKFGMGVMQNKAGALAVFCGGSMLKSPGVKKFKGRTKEGIGMESSREEVIKAFGQPTTAKPAGAGQEQLEYKTLGLSFALESGKIFNILVDFRAAK